MIWLVPALIAAAAPAQVQAGQRAEIVGVIERYQRARAAGDQVALRQLLTRDVDQLVSTGEWRQGQAQAMAGMKRSSAQHGGAPRLEVTRVRALAGDVAIADARYDLVDRGRVLRRMWSSFVLVRRDGRWRIAAIRNMRPSSY